MEVPGSRLFPSKAFSLRNLSILLSSLYSIQRLLSSFCLPLCHFASSFLLKSEWAMSSPGLKNLWLLRQLIRSPGAQPRPTWTRYLFVQKAIIHYPLIKSLSSITGVCVTPGICSFLFLLHLGVSLSHQGNSGHQKWFRVYNSQDLSWDYFNCSVVMLEDRTDLCGTK